jgi:hypothetical protein
VSHHGPMHETQDVSGWSGRQLAEWLAASPDWLDAELRSTDCSIDHIDGNGAEHRREMAAERNSPWGQAGHATYRWLRKNNYPEGFQVLCANCNCGRHWNGGLCPHTVNMMDNSEG